MLQGAAGEHVQMLEAEHAQPQVAGGRWQTRSEPSPTP
jgi:hypothetical protein